jgi:integrase
VTWPDGLRWGSVEPLGPGSAQLPGSSLAGRCPTTTAVSSAALATIQPVFTDAERVALAGFLAGYRGLTREAYALDLRQFTSWCRARSLALFAVRRADIEGFARDLEARGRARGPGTRRLSAIAGFCKYAVEEELLSSSPAAHVRRPRVDYESHAVALDRDEPGALLVAAGLGTAGEHALISLLALNGLRASEATGADIEHPGLERGHRTLTITPRAARPSPSRWLRGPRGRSTWPSGSAP